VRARVLCSIGSIRPARMTTKDRAWHRYTSTRSSCGSVELLLNRRLADGVEGSKCENGGFCKRQLFGKISGIFDGISLLGVHGSIIIGPSGLLCLDSTASTGSCPTCGSFFVGWAASRAVRDPAGAASASPVLALLDGALTVCMLVFDIFTRGRGRPGSLARWL
jgi:hypothetical protein